MNNGKLPCTIAGQPSRCRLPCRNLYHWAKANWTHAARSTHCEWKGAATYWDVHGGDAVAEAAGWSYENPTPRFAEIAGYLAFSPSRLDCEIDGEAVRPQEGGFYEGWITDDVVGPFKGIPGSFGW